MRFFFTCYWLFLVVNVYCRSEFLTQLTEYLSVYLKLDRVNLILDSSENLSSKAVLIVQGLMSTLPSIIVSSRALSLAHAEDQRYKRTREALSKQSEHGPLKILILDVRENDEVQKLLMDYMNLFVHYPPDYKRSKCLIIIVNQAGSFDTIDFFKYSWSLRFLYVTLITVNNIMEANNGISIQQQINSSDVTVHQYNPFLNYSYKLPYVEGHNKLFVNKLNNLYGYPLNVGFTESIPLLMLKRKHPTNQFLTDDLYGVDAIISRTLAETMNFSLYVKVNTSKITIPVLFKCLRNNSVDFFMNILTTTGLVNPNETINAMSSIFLQPYGHKLILKQKSYYEFNYFWYLLVVVVISVIIATFSILLCLLPLNRESWNVYNIALLLLGITPAVKLRKPSERIFYISLLFVSVIVSVELLNNLMSNMLVKRKFRRYENLADLVEHNMVIGIDSAVKPTFEINPIIDKIFNMSIDLRTFDGDTGCAVSLITGSKPVNGCDVNNVMAELLSESYSDPNAEWTLGTLTGPDPLGTGMTWTTISFAHASVYVDQCNLVLRSLLEAGLLNYWRNSDHAKWYFKGSRSIDAKDKSFRFKNPPDPTRTVLEYKKVELNMQMIGILIMGYGVACLSFILEIIWRTIKTNQIRKRKP